MKLGIFGGTFSPPHIGHVKAATAFVKSENLDKLLIIPTFIPPHKEIRFGTNPEQRLEMCRIAFSGVEKTEVSDMELRRGGKSYTVDTLHQLTDGNSDITVLVGTDMFLSLDTWYHADEIFRLAKIAYIRRESDSGNTTAIRKKADEYRTVYGADITEIISDVTEVSSTEVTEKLRSGDDCRNLLTKEIYDYITSRGLYR